MISPIYLYSDAYTIDTATIIISLRVDPPAPRRNSECARDERYEILRNVRCDEYANKTKREAAFKNLIEEMKYRGFQNFSLEILRKEMKNIKTVVTVAQCYFRLLVGIAFFITMFVFLIFKSKIANRFKNFHYSISNNF
jgi:hypothetical protein